MKNNEIPVDVLDALPVMRRPGPWSRRFDYLHEHELGRWGVYGPYSSSSSGGNMRRSADLWMQDHPGFMIEGTSRTTGPKTMVYVRVSEIEQLELIDPAELPDLLERHEAEPISFPVRPPTPIVGHLPCLYGCGHMFGLRPDRARHHLLAHADDEDPTVL